MAEGHSKLEDGRHIVASTSHIFVNLDLEKEKENMREKHNLNPTKKIKFQVYSRSNNSKSSNKMKIVGYTILKKENRKTPYYNPLRVLYPRPSASDENVVSSSDDTVVMDFPARSPRVANNNVKMDEEQKSPLNTDSSDGVDERDPHPLPSSVSAGDNIWDFDQILTVSTDDEETHDQLPCSSKKSLEIISISSSAASIGHDECSDCEEEGRAQEKSPACLPHPDNHENVDISVGGEDHMDHQDHDDIMDASVTSERAAGHNASAADHLALASPPPFLDPASPSAHRARSPSPKAPGTPELVVDTWTPLNPHESMTTPKPIKVKKTLKLPPSMRNQKSNKPLPPLPSISDYLNEEMSSHSHRFGSFAMVPAALSDLAHQEYERRKDRDREQRRERLNQREEAKRNIFANDEEDVVNDHGFDGYENDMEPAGNVDGVNEGYNDDQDYHDIEDEDFDLPNPHIGGEVGPLVAGELNPFLNGDDDPENETLSYEEMVARKVEEYVTQSQDYMRSSELARKVAAWHEMIGPRLEAVEKRIAFDIHAYGSKIINNFTPQRTEVPFNTIVGGQKSEEVSRSVQPQANL